MFVNSGCTVSLLDKDGDVATSAVGRWSTPLLLARATNTNAIVLCNTGGADLSLGGYTLNCDTVSEVGMLSAVVGLSGFALIVWL